jgi:hypothetical protein
MNTEKKIFQPAGDGRMDGYYSEWKSRVAENKF